MEIWRKISLRVRIYIILVALVTITMSGGMVTVWYTYQMEHLLTAITEKDLAAFRTAEALEIALANQKGFVSYYFIEGDAEWLRQLGEFRQIFKERLNDALQLAETEPERAGGPSLPGNHHIIRSYRPPRAVQFSPYLSKMICGFVVERQHFKPGGQGLDVCQIPFHLL